MIYFASPMRAWRGGAALAVLAAATAMTLPATPAKAQYGFWSGPGYYADERRPALRPKKRLRARAMPNMAPEPPKTAAKPVGPLLLAISIDKQRLKVYDANGLWTETPISSGTRSHPTPMGVFSIIQKSKWHRSNLYSSAPMPYMQRITWSGVALHAGVLPGYPASHGCIRLPASFAAQLWTWTQLGVRVVIAPGEYAPSEISHPRLIAQVQAPEKAAEAPFAAPRRLAMAEPASRDDSDGARVDLRLISATDDDKPAAPAATHSTTPAGTPADSATKTTAPDTADAAPPAAAPAVEETAIVVQRPDSVADAPTRTGHVAAFVSRKEGKLFVRQGFNAWFETPVTIAQPERPIGTHVFTAQIAKDDTTRVKWTALSLPPEAPKPVSKPKTKGKQAAEPSPLPAPEPVSATEALERVTIPPHAMERIAAALSAGSSLTISDHGLGPETGRGTDFIVLTR